MSVISSNLRTNGERTYWPHDALVAVTESRITAVIVTHLPYNILNIFIRRQSNRQIKKLKKNNKHN